MNDLERLIADLVRLSPEDLARAVAGAADDRAAAARLRAWLAARTGA